MSMSSIQKINCPQCDNPQDFEIWESVNVKLDPNLKEKILNRHLLAFKCNKCGQKTVFVYPLLYHDMDKKFMIYLVPEDEYNEEQFEKLDFGIPEFLAKLYQYRIVFSIDELIEKILIFDEGFDDKVMEIFKGWLLPQEITDESELEETKSFFSCCASTENNEKAIIIYMIKNGTISENAYPLDVYVNMAKEFSPKLIDEGETGKWLRIDRYSAINSGKILCKKEGAV